MAKLTPPSPVEHPNAYAGFTTVGAAGLLVYELHTRLNVDITQTEALFIIGAATWLVLFLGRKAA